PVGPQEPEDCPARHLEARAGERLLAAAAEPSAAEGLGEVFRVHGEHNPLIVPCRARPEPNRTLKNREPSDRTDLWSASPRNPPPGAALPPRSPPGEQRHFD